MLIRHLIRHVYRRPADEGGDLGGAPAADTSAPAIDTPVDTTSTPAADAPSSMLDAINRHFSRDELGRFASPAEKAAAEAAQGAQPGQPAQPKPAADPNKPPAEDDPTVMPDGLGQKAQERFQRLAGTVKELTARTEQLDQQVSYVRDTFQQHGISQQQFEQAAGVIGMLNKGDYRGALQVLDQQRQQIALQLGEALPGVDALQGFPDLRQKVDGLLMTEADALEVARLRQTQSVQQQQRQQVESQQREQQTQQQAVQTAQAAVDAWWKQTAATDIDAPAIEAKLLPHIPALLQGVPPAAWANVIQQQYRILKEAAGSFRRQPPPPSGGDLPLRPNGSGSQPQQRPQSMHEAMWGRPAPG